MRTAELMLLLAGPIMAIGLLKYRADFRRHGSTTPLGVVLLLAAWFMPHLVLGYAFPMFPAPRAAYQWVGYGLMAVGAIACGVAMSRFSGAMVVGRDAKTLITSGAYRWSRNPQYVTYTLVPVGYALRGVAVLPWIAIGLYLVLVHLTVLIEEEHLEREFGEAYRAFKQATPRYLIW